jgi:glycosyltransferase involved in cell wall biosynthesis
MGHGTTSTDRRRLAPRLVTVVVPSCNAAATLGRQLDCLTAQDYGGAWEIVVGDNGSTDGTPDVVHDWTRRLPCLRFVDASSRRGASHARNVAAATARGDFLAFSDADDEVDSHWLTALVAAARGYDVVGGLLDEAAVNNATQPGRRPPTQPWAELPVLLDFLPYVVGTNMGIWQDTFDAIGGWNEAYPRANDVELSWRAQSNGHTVGFAPEAVVRYRHRAAVAELFRQFHQWGYADAQLFRDFRAAGLERRPASRAIRHWGWVLKHAPDALRAGTARNAWLMESARVTGRVRGSLSHRVLFL